jgi:hypothetical protein
MEGFLEHPRSGRDQFSAQQTIESLQQTDPATASHITNKTGLGTHTELVPKPAISSHEEKMFLRY